MSVDHYLTLINERLRKARIALAGWPTDELALKEIRKIKIIVDVCLEVHNAEAAQ